MLRPNRGESKDNFIKRFVASSTPLKEDPPPEALAWLAWEEATTSHAGPSDSPCCTGRTLDHLRSNVASYQVKVSRFEGRDHIVVPVVMLTEGVHAGSGGPVFYPKEEIAKFPGAWNGVPVPLYHPDDNGFPISCNSPEVLENQNVGRVFGAKVINGGEKLKAELWLDILKLQEKDPALLSKINTGQPIEVSTGLFFEEDASPGEWKGEQYPVVARNHRPDHLAILPTGAGACSVADGCGIRANACPDMIRKRMALDILFNATNPSFDGIRSMIRRKMEAWDKPSSGPGTTSLYHYLSEVWPSEFIYEKEETGKKPLWFKQKYKMTADKMDVEFEGDPVAVQQKITYVEVKNQGGTNVKKEEKINYLKTNGVPEVLFKEADDATLDYLVKNMEDRLADEEVRKQLQADNEKLKANQYTPPKTTEEFVKQAPPEIQTVLNRAMSREKAEHAALVANLVKAQTVYNEAELQAMPVDALEKIATLARATMPSDFSMRGPVPDPIVANIEEPMEAPILFAQK